MGACMFKVIVVGTDGSDRAAVAVRHAFELARTSGAKVYGVHVVRPAMMLGTEQIDAAAVAAVNAGRHEESERIGKQLRSEAEMFGVGVEVLTFDGDPADALVKVAETENADLVVVGNRGMAGLKRFALGSVPNKVSHHCPCSLLIVDTDRASAT